MAGKAVKLGKGDALKAQAYDAGCEKSRSRKETMAESTLEG